MIPELTTKEMETLKAQADARKNPKSAEAFFHMAFSQFKPIYAQLSELLKDFTWSEEKQVWTSTSENAIELIKTATGPKSDDQHVSDRTVQMLVCYLGIKVIVPESNIPRCDSFYNGKHLFSANSKTGTLTFSAPTAKLKKRFGILVRLAKSQSTNTFFSASHNQTHEREGATNIKSSPS